MSNHFRFSRIALIAAVGVLMTMPLYGVTKTWTGNGLTNNWSDANNWSPLGAPIQLDGPLIFAGSNRTNNVNDVGFGNNSYLGLRFSAGAAAFTLNGETVFLGNGTAGNGGIINSSTNAQRVNFTVVDLINPSFQGLYLNNNQTFNASAGDLLISGTNLGTNTNFAGPGTVTLTITGAHMTTISSRITDDPFTGLTPLFILKQGTGTLVLGGFNNTYTGGVEIDAGRLEVASFTALGLGNTTIFIGTLATFGPNALAFNVGNNFNMIAGFPLAIWEVKVGGLIPGLTADHMTTGFVSELTMPSWVPADPTLHPTQTNKVL